MDNLTNPNLSLEELKKLLEEREKADSYLEEAESRAKQADIEKRLKASEAEWEANSSAREARKAKEAAEQAKRLPINEWKNQYPQYLKSTAEDMSGDSRSMKYIDDLIKQSKSSNVNLDDVIGDFNKSFSAKDISNVMEKYPNMKKGDDVYNALNKMYSNKFGTDFEDVFNNSRFESIEKALPLDYKNSDQYVKGLADRGLDKNNDIYSSIKNNYNKKYSDDIKRGFASDFDSSFDNIKNTPMDTEASSLAKSAKINKLKNLARGVGKGLATGAAWGLALDPSEMAVSELPNTQEGLDQLEGEMRMKNAPYNYPTRFIELRKKIGR